MKVSYTIILIRLRFFLVYYNHTFQDPKHRKGKSTNDSDEEIEDDNKVCILSVIHNKIETFNILLMI